MAVVYVSENAKKSLPARAEADHYPTDYWYARALIERMHQIRQNQDNRDVTISQSWEYNKTARILDPGCGNDPVFARAMRDLFEPLALEVWGFDIRQDAISEARAALDVAAVCDFTGFPGMMSGYPEWDVIVGNPPYNLAEPFVRKALECLRPAGWLGFLLPITFLASKGRAEGLYRDFPPHTIMFLGNRPSFSGDGQTAPSEYVFILWKKGYNGPSYSEWFVSSEPAEVKAARLARRRAARKLAREQAELEREKKNFEAWQKAEEKRIEQEEQTPADSGEPQVTHFTEPTAEERAAALALGINPNPGENPYLPEAYRRRLLEGSWDTPAAPLIAAETRPSFFIPEPGPYIAPPNLIAEVDSFARQLEEFQSAPIDQLPEVAPFIAEGLALAEDTAAELEAIPGAVPAEVCPTCRQPGNDVTAFDDKYKEFACGNPDCDTGLWMYMDGVHVIFG